MLLKVPEKIGPLLMVSTEFVETFRKQRESKIKRPQTLPGSEAFWTLQKMDGYQ
jgi:hypothetical protein